MSVVEFMELLGAGFAIGIYSTAIGAGGGFLLGPLLLLRHPAAAPVAIATAALSVAFCSSGIAAAASARGGRLDHRLAGTLAASAIPAAILGGATTALLPRSVFALGFAVLLLAVATYLIWRPEASLVDPVTRGWRRGLTDRDGNMFFYRVPMLRSIVGTSIAAFVAALAGIGGGLIYTPLGTRLMRMPHAIAVPVAQGINASIAAVVVLFHLGAGHAGDPMRDVPPLAIGVIAAVPLGRWVHHRLGEGPLTRALAVGLLIVSVRTAFVAI